MCVHRRRLFEGPTPETERDLQRSRLERHAVDSGRSPFDPMVARLDDEGLTDERRDHAARAGRVVPRDEVDEAIDVLVRRQVVAGDCQLEAEHLGAARCLVRRPSRR